MRCVRCGFQNPDGFAFCGKCGAPLGMNSERLSKLDLDHLRIYLSPDLIEALQFDLLSPAPRMLEQCLQPLARLFNLTSTFLPFYLVEQIVADPAQGQVGGAFVEGTLLLADMNGFTGLAEELGHQGQEGAELSIDLVNRCFTAMLTVLHAYEGSLIQFDGDALLGLFTGAGHATRAVQAAYAGQQVMIERAARAAQQQQVPVQVSIAVRTGRFFAARLGTPQRMIQTLLGKDVNATAKLEAVAESGQVLMDRRTLEAVTLPCQVIPCASEPDCLVLQHVDGVVEVDGRVVVRPAAFSPQATMRDLRRMVTLLDVLTPYLPTGLLPRLVSESGTSALAGEHRLVSTLFANVIGLGEMVDRLGPGHEPAIVGAANRYLTGMAAAIHRYGGVVNKIDLAPQGEKLLAFFGAPLSHEDDAERAVRAAMAMQEALPEINQAWRALAPGEGAQSELPGLCLEQKIGISYGYVFAGTVGTHWRREYTVMGDQVNLAERLLTATAAGSVTIGDDVRRRVQSCCELAAQPEVRFKGKKAPLPTYSVLRVWPAAAVVREHGEIHSPLVGRQAEWQLLVDAIERLMLGQGQLISIVGEVGLGKSRLLNELSRCVDPAVVRWIEGRCLSYTESVSYWPLQELVRQIVGLSAQDRGAAGWDKLLQVLEEAPSLLDIGAVLPYVAEFCGLPLESGYEERMRYLDAEALQRRTFIAISILLEAFARTSPAPLVLVLEDIHWMDQASLVMLEYLLPLVDRVPLMWILLYRPDRTRRYWQVHERIKQEFAHCATVVELQPLPLAESQQLLRNLVHIERWPARMEDTLLQRAEGNPLFLEEVLRSLIDSQALVKDADGQWQVGEAAQELSVPDTLQGVIMTRLDRLDESSRWTAQVAAVIGRTFAFDVLLHILAAAQEEGSPAPEVAVTEAQLIENLAQLQAHEIVHQSQQEQAPYSTYTFNHPLVQDVCYLSLLTHVRHEYHRRVARYLLAVESAAPDGVERWYPFIAYHAFAGQDWPRALQYQRLAGERAQKLFANETAIDHFRKVLRSAEHLPDDETVRPRLAALLGLGELLTMTGEYEEAEQCLVLARTLAVQLGSREMEAHAYRWLARQYELRSDYPSAVGWIQAGLVALAGRETVETTQLLLIAGLINTRLGNYESALDQCEISLRIAEKLGEAGVLARSYTLLGHLNRLRGINTMAVWYFARGLDLYEIVGDVNGQGIAHDLIATAQFHMGLWDEAERHYLQAREIFDLIGNKYSLALADNNLGGIALNQGRLDEALAFYRRALRALEQMGESLYVQGALYVNLGHTFLRMGELQAANDHLATARRHLEAAHARDWMPELHRHMAEAALLADDLDQAHEHVQRALHLARELEMRNEQGNSLRVLTQVLMARGEFETAGTHLEQSRAILEEAKDEYEWARTMLVLAQLHCRQGEAEACAAALDRCAPVLERLGARLEMQEIAALRRGLDGSAATEWTGTRVREPSLSRLEPEDPHLGTEQA